MKILVAALLASLVAFAGAEFNVSRLRQASEAQQAELGTLGRQAQSLGDELRRLQAENLQIRRLLGDRGGRGSGERARHDPPTTMRGDRIEGLARRMGHLVEESNRTRAESDRLHRLAMRVLNVRRLEELVRARVVAALPSINPVAGTNVASAFGWRMDPWPSFHAGVDLDANYGDEVRAAAAGTVASADWDGGYGLKVDIDHHNGYHTWYAHLSRTDVQPGQYVRKAQPIALVGATGDATGPHLHYQVMYAGHAIDPAPFLSGVPPKVLASLK